MFLLFWLSLFVVFYAYAGYALSLMVLARVRQRGVSAAYITPSVSVIMAAHNEEANLPRKLTNLRELAYPADRLQIVIASDGSTDRTVEILRQAADLVTPVVLEKAGGKAAALNAAVQKAHGDILLFLDTRQRVEPQALAELVSCFADAEVGAVSGELLLEAAEDNAGDALGIYWKIEKMVRKLESQTGSVVGVTGAIYALRRELFVPIPAGTILDDVLIPMQAARLGRRVIFMPSAVARDRIFSQAGKEFGRKVRTLTGNYQLLRLAPWLLTPENPLLIRFICHKLLRLAVPLLLVVLLISSALLGGRFYGTIFWLQLVLYGLAVLGQWAPGLRRIKVVAVAHTFLMLNAAAAVALYNFATGRTQVWV